MEQKTCIELKEINYALIRQSIINDELLKIFEEFKQSEKILQEQIDELNEKFDILTNGLIKT